MEKKIVGMKEKMYQSNSENLVSVAVMFKAKTGPPWTRIMIKRWIRDHLEYKIYPNINEKVAVSINNDGTDVVLLTEVKIAISSFYFIAKDNISGEIRFVGHDFSLSSCSFDWEKSACVSCRSTSGKDSRKCFDCTPGFNKIGVPGFEYCWYDNPPCPAG